ncbi:hypothetical protein AB0I37_13720 [Micromonospora purpureochromogenes]|uniref:hypothetical protein n=1 Tax=Micromonospora purpureochromogenes TaxID=47872 RepID=UPI0033E6911A
MTDATSPMTPEQPAIPQEPTTSPDTAPEPTMPAKHSNARAWAVGGIALVVALGVGGAVIGASSDDAKPAAGAMASASPTTVAPTTAAPTTAAPTSAAPSPTRTIAPPKPKPPSYKTLGARQWKLIAKNPDAYMGKTYVVYGRVTQFDAATGTDSFRADVAHRRMADEYQYETNTILNGSESDLDNLVEDDIFRANVTVLGSFSYDTQIGGETTVPMLMVNSIKVL